MKRITMICSVGFSCLVFSPLLLHAGGPDFMGDVTINAANNEFGLLTADGSITAGGNITSLGADPDFILDDTTGTSWEMESDDPDDDVFSIYYAPFDTHPFVMESGVPENSFRIANSGAVSLGDDNAQAIKPGELELIGDAINGASIFLRNNGNSSAYFSMRGDANFQFQITDASQSPTALKVPFRIYSKAPTDSFVIESDGDIVLGTSARFSSSRMLKTSISIADPVMILELLENLTVSEWSYIRDEQGRRYIDPMAEDFWDTFGLGSPDGTISAADTAGVALSAIKG